MKSLLYVSLLLFILFISVSSLCDGVASSYSDCKNKGSDCCFIDLDYECDGNNHFKKCADGSTISRYDEIIKRCNAKVNRKIIQCSSNSSNHLMLDLLALLIFYISAY